MMVRQLLLYLVIIMMVSTNGFAHESSEALKVETLAKTTKSWNGDTLPSYPKGQPEVTILKITIPPHSKLVWHKHPVINAGILLSGELHVISESNDVLHLKEGESIVELVNTWHYGENRGDIPAQIVVFYAGTTTLPITVKK